MNRAQVSAAADARADLGPARSQPAQREGVHALPFHDLSPAEFEVFCYLLLLREHPGDDVHYYGQTGDGGRDVLHWIRDRTPASAVQREPCRPSRLPDRKGLLTLHRTHEGRESGLVQLESMKQPPPREEQPRRSCCRRCFNLGEPNCDGICDGPSCADSIVAVD